MASSNAGSDCEGEDQEDSPSLRNEVFEALEQLTVEDSANQDIEVEDELSVFRQQWQRELETTPSPQRDPPSKMETAQQISDEEKAKQLFLRGVELERGGKLYEAVQQYKRAVQILPDVERRLYDADVRATETPQGDEENDEEEVELPDVDEDEEEEMVEGEELLARLQRIVARRGALCFPAHPTKSTHLSHLPWEVVALVARWVVSAALDARSLETLGSTCRGLYLVARDPDLWRAICLTTWGVECGTPRSLGFVSWRQMYIERPRLLLHGCYISKTSYIRHGETSFQDQSYRPWYLVHYYRYLRFFPDGSALMWTTAEEPGACVGLMQREHRPGLGVLSGHYRLVGDKVVAVIRRPAEKPSQSYTRFRSRRKETHDNHDHMYHLELQLRDVRSRRNWQLAWRCYRVSTRPEHWTHFDITPNKFPPFLFSRVRGYTAEASAPLVATRAHC